MNAARKYKKTELRTKPKIARLPASKVSRLRTSVTTLPPTAPIVVEDIYPRRIGGISPIALLLRFERAICFAVFIFALMTLSAVSHQALTDRIKARDLRISIQGVKSEIGRLREDLQSAQSNLVTLNAPEGIKTIPIEPGDVSIIELPREL